MPNLTRLAILLIFLLSACNSKKKPQGILDEKKMIGVMTDLHVIDGYMANLSYLDSVRINGKDFYATVYKKHNISRTAYEKSLEYYSRTPPLLDSMYSLVEKRLEENAARLMQQAAGDTSKIQSK